MVTVIMTTTRATMNNTSKWLIGTLLFAAFFVSAHQQKTAFSTVLFNPRSENIEIMHRFRVHDAEHAVKQILGKDADIINSRKTVFNTETRFVVEELKPFFGENFR